MDEKDELNYELGNRAAWLSMLQSCLRQLGIDDEDAGRARWVSEREQIQRLCFPSLRRRRPPESEAEPFVPADSHRQAGACR